jgi:hypothetical protein
VYHGETELIGPSLVNKMAGCDQNGLAMGGSVHGGCGGRNVSAFAFLDR